VRDTFKFDVAWMEEEHLVASSANLSEVKDRGIKSLRKILITYFIGTNEARRWSMQW
jgi:hypothetical protein